MTADEIRAVLAGRLADVDERIHAACRRSGRARDDVTLVVVTKSVPAEVAALLPALGMTQLGESRPQELWRKAAALPADVHWHLIGHLQRNKVERTMPLVEWIHAVDSLRLLTSLDQEMARHPLAPRPVAVLLEVNASRESSKHGFAPEELPALASQLAAVRHVHVRGLMTMAAFEEDPERCRPTFAEVRRLRDLLRREIGAPHHFDQLSMGMSSDFEVAVEEGATFVRIGTALFQGLAEEPS